MFSQFGGKLLLLLGFMVGFEYGWFLLGNGLNLYIFFGMVHGLGRH